MPLILATFAVVVGCEMDLPQDPAPGSESEAVVANQCTGRPAQTRRDWQYPASVADDFTDYERGALDRLHDEGWNGDGIAIVVRDEFNPDGSPSHGEAVLNVARHYAPNALFIRSLRTAHGQRSPPDEYYERPNPIVIQNNSFSGTNDDGTVDALPVEQSGSTSEPLLEVWGAGNVVRPLGNGPADAVPAIEENLFVYLLSAAFDFTTLMDTVEPCAGSECRNGLLHAKSGALVVGSVDYRRALDDWTLAYSDADGTHSARAGHARNAFIMAPDDNREDSFAGTSFSAPRVSAALAILSQKCPGFSRQKLSFILLQSAQDLGEPGVDAVYGYGLLDLQRAMEQAETLAAKFDDFDSTIPPTP